ncbi:MAG: alanine--tRNA ligase [Candidatus Liptonbacteria bacterium]|nr:alanine--tRNA ligase [Candidatus Liptonbacteria bacterium]
MTSFEIRQKFLKFFQDRGHAVIPSAPLVPENDPTTLFTGSGMQPLIPYLLGQSHPLGKRLVNSQKCFRAEDIEEVGDNRHTTFFEMLGNWSFGDYWKEEQLSWFLEFLTDEVHIKKEGLAVSCFEGDPSLNLPPDNESAEIWKKLGIPKERIYFYGAKKNWWSRSGVPANMPAGEPGGPDSEVFFEFTLVPHDKKYGDACHPNCDCGRFMEIGNSVFMEYKKNEDGTFEKLKQRNVDFGGGLERITAAANDDPDVFRIDVFAKMKSALTEPDKNNPRKLRIILDHLRASVFLIADEVRPSNKGQGYVLRRLLRRMGFHYFDLFSHRAIDTDPRLSNAILALGITYQTAYPEMYKRIAGIPTHVTDELEKFEFSLEAGLREFKKLSAKGKISGQEAFALFSTHGFPYEMAFELAEEQGIEIDESEFELEMKKHQDLSRTASAGTFKGGLADSSEKTTRLHTAHHLLLKALQLVLGSGVKQRGSNITQERLRMDFSYEAKMTDEQKKEAERIVNEKIAEDLPVIRNEMALEDAEKLHAEHEFGAKYPARVSVYSVGPKGATPENPQFEKAFSIEFCGGPHVTHTGVIGKFRIKKEEAVGAGIRRVRGVVK